MTHVRSLSPILGLALVGALLQGCSGQPGGASGPSVRLFAADVNNGAKVCEVSKPALAAGKVVEATMKRSGNTGWCGLPVSNGGKPFDAGLLVARPAHGKALVHTVGNDTRIDYTPEFGFTGTDSFTVQVLPSEASVRIAVTVTAP